MVRNAFIIEYSFYKNITMFLTHFWFGIVAQFLFVNVIGPFNLFSGQTFHDDWIMALFNELLTALPPIAGGFFEKDVKESLLMKV